MMRMVAVVVVVVVVVGVLSACPLPPAPPVDAGPAEVVWPNEESVANSDPWLMENHSRILQMRPRVLALNFVNTKSMEQMHDQLQQAVDAIAEGSRYRGYADPDAPVFLQYELAHEVDLRDGSPDANAPLLNSTRYPRELVPTGSWGLDYGAFFTEAFAEEMGIEDPDTGEVLTLCELIDSGRVHEVWIYGDADVPDVAAAEIVEKKPFYDQERRRTLDPMNACAGNGCFDFDDDVPCERTVRIAWFNHTRGPGCFLESLSHGMESIGAWNANQLPSLSKDFIPFSGHDLDGRLSLPIESFYDCPYDRDCLEYPSETSVRYIAGAEPITLDPYDPICGNAHWPPNGRRQYDLDNEQVVQTTCMRFGDEGDETDGYSRALIAPYESLAPDCMGPWLVFWRQSMPGLNNRARSDDGAEMLNWWPYLFY
jgi:hypothetical protein